MLCEPQPAPGVGDAVWAAADVGAAFRPLFTVSLRDVRGPFGRLRWSKRSHLLGELENFSRLSARFQRTVMTFLMLPMHLWIIEHRRRGCLSRWGLTQRFLIRFEQCVDHTVSRSFPFQSKEGPFRLFHPTFVLPP